MTVIYIAFIVSSRIMAVRHRRNQKEKNSSSESHLDNAAESTEQTDLNGVSQIVTSVSSPPTPSQMFTLCGFDTSDFKSWQRFVGLLCRPTDPSSLGILRFSFGKYVIFIGGTTHYVHN